MNPKNAAHETSPARQDVLAEGYRQMAADIEREMEADEWAEALVGDVLEVTRGSAGGSAGRQSSH
jgi:hypothetical protein